MTNPNWYYEISLKDRVALRYTKLPEFYGNMGSVHEMTDATLADLSFAVKDRGFLRHDVAIKAGIEQTTMKKARDAAREIALEDIRDQRDHLLSVTDVAATVDRWNAMDVVQQYKVTEYRQLLRDITKQPDIFNIKWPDLPAELDFVRKYEWPADIPLSAELKAKLDAAPTPTSKEQLQTEQWARIMKIRDARVAGGVRVNGKWFHTDSDSLIRYLALLAAGNNIPVGIRWKTMDGTFVDVTPDLVRAVYASAISANNAIFQHAELLRAQLNASVDPKTFDINAGWPAVYADFV